MGASRFASKVVVVAAWLVLALKPLATHAQSEVSFPVSECKWKWLAKYQCDGTKVEVRIKLTLAPGVTTPLSDLKTKWEKGIESKWSNKRSCLGAGPKIVFDVKWVSSGEHHAVTVLPGTGPTDMYQWYEVINGNTAAHEFGHMLGMKDEYEDIARCPSRSPINTHGVMQHPGNPVLQKYVDEVCSHCSAAEPLAARPEETPDGAGKAGEEKLTAGDLDKLTRVDLAVSGGPPGDRLQYAISINEETKTVGYKYLNELKLACTKEGFGEVTADTLAKLKEVLRGSLEALERGTDDMVADALSARVTVDAGGKKLVAHYRLTYVPDDPWSKPSVRALEDFHRLVTEQAQMAGATEPPK